ncbi:SDR family NAD(P)-dependent oxidoreductase [Celeribacter indicus]|uniref:Short-chain dehydrogenase/reductase SDR n=1 Tax=Celeribacter indicus TaxID=1208324 RepID=A0A0B5DZE1_9RHOB|nr:SDR family oxidoreductase [Celeribacter indicus]AJE48823.1 short-chain dehydrogenase/reductase SDR [Celeribacter indicus]SDW38384.1 NAD(P)-dependent dehydrogenase, short-chain alcohol dehydrogenase family [Celeribacter indicus]
MSLEGKVVVVTGGGAGIGRACCVALAASGATVAVGDIDPGTAAETLATIEEAGGRGLAGRVDVTSSELVEAFVNGVTGRFGRIDGLVNAAGGIVSATSVADCSEEDWDRTFVLNVKSTYLVSRAVLPAMLASGSGAIVNFSSAAGLAARRNLAAYSAAKGAIVALTRAMAADFGDRGIRVNCVAPGPTMTDAFRAHVQSAAYPDAVLRERASEQLLGRLGKPEDIAKAVLFLLSGEADWITGHTYPVDGGNTA